MVKVSPKTFRGVRWLIIAAMVVQFVVVPWRVESGSFEGGVLTVPPAGPPTIDEVRPMLEFAFTIGLALLWTWAAKPKE